MKLFGGGTDRDRDHAAAASSADAGGTPTVRPPRLMQPNPILTKLSPSARRYLCEGVAEWLVCRLLVTRNKHEGREINPAKRRELVSIQLYCGLKGPLKY